MGFEITIAEELMNILTGLKNDIDVNDIYSLALFTDDSFDGVDLAINTKSNLEKIKKEKIRKYEEYSSKWFTIEWEHEGGFYSNFTKSSELMNNLMDTNDEDAPQVIVKAFIEALKSIRQSSFFDTSQLKNEIIYLVAVSDSEEDEFYMDKSIREINSERIYNQFIEEKKIAEASLS